MRRLFVVLAVAGVLAATGIAWAAIPHSTTGVITGCYNTVNGSLKVVNAEAGATCSGNETALTWSQAGPQGPAGVSGYERVSDQAVVSTEQLNGYNATHSVDCPSGKKVLGGGFHISENGTYYVRVNRPSDDDTWSVTVKLITAISGTPTTWTPQMTVYATCADA